MKREPDPFDKYAEQLLEDMKKSGREIKTSGQAEDIMAHMLGRLLTKMLEGEMTHHLGYEKGQACKIHPFSRWRTNFPREPLLKRGRGIKNADLWQSID